MDLKTGLRTAQLKHHFEQLNCRWSESLDEQTDIHIAQLNNGNLRRWINALEQMPNIKECASKLNQATISIHSEQITTADQLQIRTQLQALMPWRKGPYELFGMLIDTEWRSDYKWQRLQNDITSLAGKTVLDVGCANGYFSLRMAGCGAKLVVGVDPSWLFIAQFMSIQHYLDPTLAVYLLPFTLEEVPCPLHFFDTVFSMGVLYHRKSPFDHLQACLDALKPGGQLVLETLVIEDKQGEVLVPQDRYARMRNVWFIPNTEVLCSWLIRAGFKSTKLIDESNTSTDEQRATDWMQFASLDKCLDPSNPRKTIEGYPAPRRAIISAQKPI